MSTAKIAAKLVAAMKDIDAVEKKGRNNQQSYNYVRSADVANEVRKALATAGIAFTYSVVSERTWESQTKSGTTQFFCSLMVAVTFTDSETGESISAQTIGWGADSQEKAPYKAMTGALKYALRMNFLIPDESDPEESVVQESVRPQPSQAAAHAEPARSHSSFRYSKPNLTCHPLDVTRKDTRDGKKQFIAVKLNGKCEGKDMAFCWHASLFDALLAAKDRPAQLEVELDGEYLNITDVLEVAGKEYRDGKPYVPGAVTNAQGVDVSDDDIPF